LFEAFENGAFDIFFELRHESPRWRLLLQTLFTDDGREKSNLSVGGTESSISRFFGGISNWGVIRDEGFISLVKSIGVGCFTRTRPVIEGRSVNEKLFF
jgi:hypothetical protein